MRKSIALGMTLTVLACTPAVQAKVDALVKKGALFCAKAEGLDGSLTVMLANTAGVPVSVTDQASDVVAKSCALIGDIPVRPPANPQASPVVPAATTLPPITS